MVMITITISIITFVVIVILIIISKSISLQGKDVSMHRRRTFEASMHSHLPGRLNKDIRTVIMAITSNTPLITADYPLGDWYVS